MLTFFHGWRRKMGVVTLVTACGLMGMWVRSGTTDDSITICFGGKSIYALASVSFGLEWQRIEHRIPLSKTFEFVTAKRNLHNQFQVSGVYPELDFLAFQYGYDEDLVMVASWTIRVVPYWSIVLPLTAVSAWLLLSKPRLPPNPLEECE